MFLSALPGFALSIAAVRGVARFGTSEVMTFMLTMPTFVILWFYSIGWAGPMAIQTACAISGNDTAFDLRVYGFPIDQLKAKEKALAQHVLARL